MWWWMAVAFGAQCETIGMADVMAVTPPAVVVLGDRHGVVPDANRAVRIVQQLARRAPTVLAVEAILGDQAAILERYNAGTLLVGDLYEELEWERTNGWPYGPYSKLFEAAYEERVPVVAAGLPIGVPPDEAEFPVPGGYMSVLRGALGEADVPLAAQSDLIRTIAWRDHRIARQALEGWSGEGYLVVLTDRVHVEGGKGVPWQIGLETRVPVHTFVLAWGHDPPCFAGDRVWAPGLSEMLGGAVKPEP